MKSHRILVNGGGLVGSLLSILLKKRGYDVTVIERRPDMRKTPIQAGRSINLALSDRGLKALASAGLLDEVKPYLIPMYGRMIHDLHGNLSFQRYGNDNQWINSVGRGVLNKLLLQKAEDLGVELIFNTRICKIEPEKKEIYSDTGETFRFDKLLACDGAFSVVRLHMVSMDRFNYSQTYLDHGYCEIHMMPADNGNWKMEPHALHIWPRKSFMLIALPNPDGSFTCTLFLPFQGKFSFDSISHPKDAETFVQKWFADIIPWIPDYADQFANNVRSSLMTVRCSPWYWGSNILLLGDAAHAIVPFYGQGMNAGFEDARIFCEWVDKYGGIDSDNLLADFATFRQPDGHAIADLALKNFIEMRDLTADKNFILRKKIEAWFASRHPDRWIPQYSLVSFSHVPYSEALKIGTQHDMIMEKVMSLAVNTETQTWEEELAEKIILEELNK